MSITIPHTITDDQATAFQRLYLETYKEDISLEEAKKKGLHLAQFMATIITLRADMRRTQVVRPRPMQCDRCGDWVMCKASL